MSTSRNKPIKAIVLKPLFGAITINSYHLKVFTFEIELQKLATTKIDIKLRNIKKYRKWEW